MSQSPPNSSEVPEKLPGGGRRWSLWLATGLGTGYLPIMPGTYGSALGVALVMGLHALAAFTPYPRLAVWFASLATVPLSIVVTARALRFFREEDPQVIVVDEVAGQSLTLLPLAGEPATGFSYWLAVFVGFVLFRALDAIKPYPIWKFGHLKGAWGVVADDLAAGAVAAALLLAFLHFF